MNFNIEAVYPLLANLTQTLLLFIVGWLVINLAVKAMGKILTGRFPNAILQAFLLSITRIAARVLLLITCLDMINVPVSSLVTALGAVGLALSLAMQDSLGNLAQGVVILFSRPFQIGDFVEIDGLGGTVEDMDLLHVTLSTPDRKRIFIANSQTAKAKIINYSALPERRLETVIEITSREDINRVKELLQSIIVSHPLALRQPEPTVHLSGMNSDTAQIVCRVWVNSKQYWNLYYSLLESVRVKFADEGIACPPGKQLMRIEDKPLPGS